MLRPHPERILVNTIKKNETLRSITGGMFIVGYGEILKTEITSKNKSCSAPGSPKIATVKVVIPTSCECPYEWPLTIKCKPRRGFFEYETSETFVLDRYYGFSGTSSTTPDATVVADETVKNIESDQFACVHAAISKVLAMTSGASTFKIGEKVTGGTSTHTGYVVAVSGSNLYLRDTTGIFLAAETLTGDMSGSGVVSATLVTNDDTIVLVGKDSAHGFDVFTDSGVVTGIAGQVVPILSTEDMHKIFPVRYGQEGNVPNLPVDEDYCLYSIVTKKAGHEAPDLMVNNLVTSIQEVQFYVRKSLTTDANMFSLLATPLVINQTWHGMFVANLGFSA